MEIVPVSLKVANAFVDQYHRHHGPSRGHKFSIGVRESDALIGVAIVGRVPTRGGAPRLGEL